MGDLDGKRDALSGALRFIMVASIPSAIGLLVIGQPLIRLLERGAFDSSASALVYSTLSMFTLGLIVHAALEVVARGFYADKDTLTPLWAALGGAGINLVLSFLLSGVADVEQNSFMNTIVRSVPTLGYQPMIGNVSGLALANSLGVTFEVVFLLILLRRRWDGIREDKLAQTTLKTLIASLVMALAVLGIDMLWRSVGFANRGLLFTIAQVGIETLSGAVVFVIVAYVLKLEELHQLRAIILRRRLPNELETAST